MKRLTTISFLLAALVSQAAPLITITNDTMLIKHYDSFDVEQFANRFTCYDESAWIGMNPNFLIRPRNDSRSGDNDQGDLTNRLPAIEIPIIHALHGTNTIIRQLYCSGNGAPTSNSTFTNMQLRLLAPAQSYNRFNVLTNDWDQPTNNIINLAYSDSAYYGTALQNEPVRLYGVGGSNAAALVGVPFVDSLNHTLFIVTNTYPDSSNLFFPAGHPANEIQLCRAIQDLRLAPISMDTNIWSFTGDWNSTTPSQTNHCTVTGISTSATVWSSSFHPDRMIFGYDNGTVTHTNDGRAAFTLMPALSNAFNEVITLTNVPTGSYVISQDGEPVSTNASVLGTLSVNFFHINTGPYWRQKLLVLDGCRQMRDINTTNASDHTAQNYLTAFGSLTTVTWPTNQGVTSYSAAMLASEQHMETLDLAIHTNAQPVTRTLSIMQVLTRYAPFHR